MRKMMWMFIAAIVMIVAILFHSNKIAAVTQYEVKIYNLSESFDGYKILQLSDLHSGKPLGLIRRIDEQEPDIVVMTGDMISTSDENFDVFLGVAEKLAKKYDTYFVSGNHEQALGANLYEELIAKLNQLGVRVIDNTFVELAKGDSKINLYGLWYNLRFYRDKNDKSTEEYVFTLDDMLRVLGKPQKGVNILLTHNPVYFDVYVKWGADLTLSGHMHGGMIRVPFKGGLFSPEKEYYPEYDGGYYEKQGKGMVVSRGLGQHKGFRFLNQPEIVVITLKK